MLGLLPTFISPTATAVPQTVRECVQSDHVWVHVEWDDGHKGGCATDFSNGLVALRSAGFAVDETGGFITKIDGRPNPAGKTDWWSYWHKAPQSDGSYPEWEFSQLSATAYKPTPGTVEGWRLWHSFSETAQQPKHNPVEGFILGGTPKFTLQPASKTVEAGQDASFTVAVSGKPDPTVMWMTSPNGSDWTEVPMATDTTFTVTNTTTAHDGLRVKARATNTSGGVDSVVATLTVRQPSATISIPDPGLRACVLKAAGVEEGELTQGKLETLTALSCVDTKPSKITDLTGLQYMTGLNELVLSTNAITDLAPISGLDALQKLYLPGNKLTNVDALGNLTNLAQVNLSRNKLVSIDGLSTLTKLQDVTVDYNELTDLTPLGGKPSLTRVVANRNQLRTIAPLATSTNLVTLAASSNQITDAAPVSGLVKLEKLLLSNNQISDVTPMSALKKLNSLDLGSNAVLDASPLKDLSSFTMLGLKIRDQRVSLPAATVGQPYALPVIKDAKGQAPKKLEAFGPNASNVRLADGTATYAVADTYEIKFSDSTWSTLGDVHGGTITQEALAYVNVPDSKFRACLNNQLGQAADAPITATQAATIETVDCFYAGVTDITGAESLTGVKSFKLELSKVTDPSPLAGLHNLTELSLDGNLVSDASKLGSLPALASLDLDSNRLTSFAGLGGMPNLVTLSLNNQGKNDKDFAKPSDLTPLAGLTQLTALNVSSNSVASLEPIGSLTGLKELLAFSNALPNLKGVEKLTALRSLNVHHNQLTSLAGVESLSSLTDLNARNNSISSVSSLTSLTSLVKLELSYNPLTDHAKLAALTSVTDLGLDTTGLTSIAFVADMPAVNWLIVHSNHITDMSPLKGRTMRGWGATRQTIALDSVPAGAPTPLPVVTGIDGAPLEVKPPKGVTVTDGHVMYPKPGDHTLAFADKPRLGKFTGTFTQPVNRAAATLSVTEDAVEAGSLLTYSGTGFDPGEQVKLVLHSDPVELGTVTASETGTVGGTVEVPAGTAAGRHTLVATGMTSEQSAQASVEVTAPATAEPTETATAEPTDTATSAPTATGTASQAAPPDASHTPSAAPTQPLPNTGGSPWTLLALGLGLMALAAGLTTLRKRA